MLERLRAGSAEGLHTARAMAVRLGELSQEEAELVGNYLRRDLTALRRWLDRSSHALSQWLDFDLDMLEGELWDWLKRSADPTELAWLENALQQSEAAEAPDSVHTGEDFHTGEICGLGSLECQACGQRVRFTKPGPIPPCPRCHKTLFSRLADS